jgi:hypothetical protein
VAKTPDRAEHQRRFMALDQADRRAVMRAVNRGKAVDNRKHAPLAVMVARRQQRFWKWSWLLGPALGAVQLLLVPVEVAAFNAGLATLGLAAFSVFWYRRAARAEQLNLELADGRRSSGAAGGPASRGHLPGERRAARKAAREEATREPAADATRDAPATVDPDQPLPGQRPYRPRGQKRRGKR